MSLSLAAFLTLAVAQDPGREVRELIERLRSNVAAERDEAARRLKEIGAPAEAELKKAADDVDADVAAQARDLLRLLRIGASLSERLRQALPGVEERLARGDDATWTEVFEAATATTAEGDRRHPQLQTADLDVLAAAAVRGARGRRQIADVCASVARFDCRSAAPDLVALLLNEDGYVRGRAAQALGDLDARDVIPRVRKLLEEERTDRAEQMITALADLGAGEAAPAVAGFLESPIEGVRRSAVTALGRIGGADAAPKLARLLDDPSAAIRSNSAVALMRLGERAAIPKLAGLLKDPEELVRAFAAHALASLSGTEAIPSLLALLEEKGPLLRSVAAHALCRLGDRRGAAVLFESASPASNDLNALREPEIWKRLGTASLDDARATVSEHLQRIAAAAKLRVEISDRLPRPVRDALSRPTTLRGPGLAPRDALEHLSARDDFHFVLEAERLRIVSGDEATAFWNAWWEEERKRRP